MAVLILFRAVATCRSRSHRAGMESKERSKNCTEVAAPETQIQPQSSPHSLPRSGRSPHSRGAILKGGSRHWSKEAPGNAGSWGSSPWLTQALPRKPGKPVAPMTAAVRCVSHSYTLRGAQGWRLYMTPDTLVCIVVQDSLLTKMSSSASFLRGVSALR